MFHFKASGIAAGAAFVLSLLIGLISAAGFPAVLIRAFLFGAGFFVFTNVAVWLINQFMPELLTGQEDIIDIEPGSRVNLTVGSGAIEGAFPTGNIDEVDNIDGRKRRADPLEANLTAAASDTAGSSGGASPSGGASASPSLGSPSLGSPGLGSPPVGASVGSTSAASKASSPASGGAAIDQSGKAGYTSGGGASGAADVDLMPDFDTLSEAFLPGASGAEAEPVIYDTPEVKSSQPVSTREALGGDFNPKELAQAIQTVLKKDEKG